MNHRLTPRKFLILTLAAGILFGLPTSAAVRAEELNLDDDEGPPPGPNAAFNARYFDELVFGKRDSAAARRELNRHLRQKIAETDLVCGLTERQRQKLSLAGRGDLKRLFDRIDERRRKLLSADEGEFVKAGETSGVRMKRVR